MKEATIVTSLGEIKLELNDEAAPNTVANFISYAKSGHYENTVFHRVISGFMIQGGGMPANMVEKKTNPPIKNEADNGLKNLTGAIAMARTAEPHSATSQFFINVNDNLFLDFQAPHTDGWGYCVFGRVVEGMQVVREIEEVETTSKYGHQDVPVSPITIEKVIV